MNKTARFSLFYKGYNLLEHSVDPAASRLENLLKMNAFTVETAEIVPRNKIADARGIGKLFRA